jgi:hypothetical protein
MPAHVANSDDKLLNQQIEFLLVEHNLRGMALARQALQPGYLARAAALLLKPGRNVLIGTGFPVAGTFETDGPVGAIAIYRMLQQLGVKPVLVCGEPLYTALQCDFHAEQMPLGTDGHCRASELLTTYQPAAVLCIERPGRADDGRYYNMRHEDISTMVADLDALVKLAYDAGIPSVGIGDGGNEIGMGNIAASLDALDIRPARTCCDELIVADVSNWAAYGLACCWSLQSGQDLFDCCATTAVLQYLSAKGSVDGVTRQNTLTEDGLAPEVGAALCRQIYQLYLQHRPAPV